MATKSMVRVNLDPTEPITFDRPIKCPTPDGKAVTITFTFKHRTRLEFAEMQQAYVDSRNKAAEDAAAEVASDARFPSPVEHANKILESDADSILEVASGWNIEGVAFTRENVLKFLNHFPGAAMAVVTDYRVGMTEGRLGNS